MQCLCIYANVQIAPLGPVYQAGTLSGNPIAMAAGLATLDIISVDGFYEPLLQRTADLAGGLREAANSAGVCFTTNHAGTMFGGFFSEESSISNYQQVMACDGERFNRFFHLFDYLDLNFDFFNYFNFFYNLFFNSVSFN